MSPRQSLSKNLQEAFSIHGDAHDWLMSLWNAIQVFDDMADGDFPDRDDLNAAIADVFCNMPANPFFQRHHQYLLPLLAMAILKWNASDEVERDGEPTEMSFAWRAGYYEIVLAVVQLVHGQDVAISAARYVMSLYGERFEDYHREFVNA